MDDEAFERELAMLLGGATSAGVPAEDRWAVLMPLRLAYRQALDDGTATTTPLTGLRLPAVRGRRADPQITPAHAAALIDAIPPGHRAAYALAFYAGLRRGELLGLRWADVDMPRGEIHVVQAWCSHTRRMTPPKSRAAVRTAPMAEGLRRILLEHQLATGRSGGLICSPGRATPLDAPMLTHPATTAWDAAGLTGCTLHAARHTYASLMIAASCNLADLSRFMGHTSITTTVDRYGHLLPGAHAEAAAKLDRLLGVERA